MSRAASSSETPRTSRARRRAEPTPARGSVTEPAMERKDSRRGPTLARDAGHPQARSPRAHPPDPARGRGGVPAAGPRALAICIVPGRIHRPPDRRSTSSSATAAPTTRASWSAATTTVRSSATSGSARSSSGLPQRLPRLLRARTLRRPGVHARRPRAGAPYAFGDLRLHRVQASIQPENERSIALVRGAGFRREGLALRYLKIGGRWRDHEHWAITAEERRDRRRRT